MFKNRSPGAADTTGRSSREQDRAAAFPINENHDGGLRSDGDEIGVMPVEKFGHFRFSWIERVLVDKQLVARAKVLGVWLATKYVNSKSGLAWPAHTTLARDLDTTDRSVRAHIAQLKECGYIEIEHHPNRRTLHYRLVLPAS